MANTAKIPAKPGKDTVYIDVDDEITSIIDKVENAKEKVVALVLPKRSNTLKSIVNMRLLKRNAENADKNVVLITSEAALLPLAGAAGLHVAKNLQSAPEIPPSPVAHKEVPAVSHVAEPTDEETPPENAGEELDDKNAKLDYHRSVGELAAVSAADDPDAVALDEDGESEKPAKAAKTPKNKKLKVPNFDRFRVLLGLGILGLVALIVFIVLAVSVLPKATITIQTASTTVSANLNLTTSDTAKALDESTNIIPAVLKTSDETSNQNVQATGQQNNGQKASGNITFSIPCSDVSGTPPTIPSGTGVTTGSLAYTTVSNAPLTTANFSGGCHFTGSTTMNAVNAGSKYNIGTSDFTISGSSYSDVSGSGSASGGTDDVVTVVSQSDVDNVKISSTDSGNFTKNFESQLASQGYYVLTSTLKLSDPVSTPNTPVGQAASTVSVSVKITNSVLAVKKTDLQKALTDALNKQLDAGKQKLSTTDPLAGATVNVQGQSSPTVVTITINQSASAIPLIDAATVQKQAEGQKAGDIQANISNNPGVKTVTVKLSPFWVSKAPNKPSKIKVILQAASSGNKSGN